MTKYRDIGPMHFPPSWSSGPPDPPEWVDLDPDDPRRPDHPDHDPEDYDPW